MDKRLIAQFFVVVDRLQYKFADRAGDKAAEGISPLYPHALAPQQIDHGACLEACPLESATDGTTHSPNLFQSPVQERLGILEVGALILRLVHLGGRIHTRQRSALCVP